MISAYKQIDNLKPLKKELRNRPWRDAGRPGGRPCSVQHLIRLFGGETAKDIVWEIEKHNEEKLK
jgi:hypothetical protein